MSLKSTEANIFANPYHLKRNLKPSPCRCDTANWQMLAATFLTAALLRGACTLGETPGAS